MTSPFLGLVLLAGSVLAGECGPLAFDCELAVAGTMSNRLADDRWPADLGGVLTAYYGRGEPSATALALAYILVSAPEMLADRAHYYAYSDQDRARMGWPAGDETVCGHGLCVHLSERWMGR